MGTWDMGAFDNDDAMDWVAELENTPDDAVVRDALAAAAGPPAGKYLETPEGAIALAAAEVVAAAAGAGGETLPEEVQSWLERHAGSVAPHVELARRAVDRVQAPENSELRDLWSEEAGADPANVAVWEQKVADLRRRLQSVG